MKRSGVVVFTFWIMVSAFGVPVLAQSSSFSFGAVGDIGDGSDAEAVLGAIPSAVDMFFVVGDLAYSADDWCSTVRASIPESFPFELVAGNHDDDVTASQNIDTFAQCLPNKISGLSGVYGRQYYVDYPTASPLARFIMISPEMSFNTGESYSYGEGDSGYMWTAAAIDQARSLNIPWVVVGMHENCITMGNKSCSIGIDLMNLLVSKKVDLILQGHDHDYQRSKQFAFGGSCTALKSGTYTPSCVVDDGADNQYAKGAGSVLVINGAGGHGLYDVNTGDSEAGYFAKWMGDNSNPRYGFTKYTVSQTSIAAEFIGATSGSFTDSFTISGTGQTVTPIPTGPTTTIQPTTPAGLTPTTPPSTCPIKPQGDSDCNGQVNLIDYDYYRRLVLLDSSVPPAVSGDFNGDGETGTMDGRILAQTLGFVT